MRARTGAEPRYEFDQPLIVHHDKPWKAGRPVRMRGWVHAWDGDLLVVARRFRSPGLPYDGLAARQEHGDHGLIELRRGAWISRRRYLRADGRLIGELFNVQTPTELAPGLARYVDLEVDVARQPGRGVEVQDLDDLARAAAHGDIPEPLAALARDLAEQLAARLRSDPAADWDLRPDPGAITPPIADFLARA